MRNIGSGWDLYTGSGSYVTVSFTRHMQLTPRYPWFLEPTFPLYKADRTMSAVRAFGNGRYVLEGQGGAKLGDFVVLLLFLRETVGSMTLELFRGPAPS